MPSPRRRCRAARTSWGCTPASTRSGWLATAATTCTGSWSSRVARACAYRPTPAHARRAASDTGVREERPADRPRRRRHLRRRGRADRAGAGGSGADAGGIDCDRGPDHANRRSRRAVRRRPWVGGLSMEPVFYASCRVGDLLIGIDANAVQEVTAGAALTPVPLASPLV